MHLFFVGVYFLEVEIAEVAPAIIRTANGFEGQCGLVLVKHHLKEHIFVGSVLAIEHKLEV